MTTHRWLALLLTLIALPTQAQVDYAKVSADLNTTALKPGSEAVAAVVLDIKKGYHSQSNTPKDENGIPAVVKPTPANGLTFGEVQYPAGVDEKYTGGLEANV